MRFGLLSLVELILTRSIFAAQYHGYSSQYSFDSNYLHAPTWMTVLPSSRNLTSLSIPGTHDTMTSVLNNPIYQCQNHLLSTQLESGIRFFDIRARLFNNTLQIFHQDQDTRYSYAEVLTTFFSFLDSHPGETILMRLKEESSPIDSTIDFIEAFNYYRLNDTRTSPGSAKHLYIPPIPGPTSVPTLGSLRGKILILQNFGSNPAQYGIKWESPLLSIQDDYDIPDLHAGLDGKWEAVREGLESAGRGIGGGEGRLYLSHLSASVGVLPIEAAAGDEGGDIVGINDRAGQWLREGNGGSTGVVIMDFPGRALIREVLGRNSRKGSGAYPV